MIIALFISVVTVFSLSLSLRHIFQTLFLYVFAIFSLFFPSQPKINYNKRTQMLYALCYCILSYAQRRMRYDASS